MSDNNEQIVALTLMVGEIKGELKGLAAGFQNFTNEVRAANKDVRGANNSQWEEMGNMKSSCAEDKQEAAAALAKYKVTNATKTVITGGASGGGLMLAWEIVKHYFKGGG